MTLADSGDSDSCLPGFLDKDSTLLVSHDQRATGIFLLRTLTQGWRPQQPTDATKMHIYSTDLQDCLHFHYEFTDLVKLTQVICKLTAEDSISYLEDDYHLEIDEAVYHQCVMEVSQICRNEPTTESTSRKQYCHYFQRAFS